jgi:hypothetical protein
MAKISVFRAIVAGVMALAIGIIVTALLNLIITIQNKPWTIVAVCLASILSALAGFLVAARPNKER